MKEIKDTLERIFTKLEDIQKEQKGSKEVQIKHQASLEEHMRRTELLEEELKPVKTHVEQVRGAGKLLGLITTILTISSLIYILVK